jgi:16S rRNA (cytidine1402-2'-O)-methyltransferase
MADKDTDGACPEPDPAPLRVAPADTAAPLDAVGDDVAGEDRPDDGPDDGPDDWTDDDSDSSEREPQDDDPTETRDGSAHNRKGARPIAAGLHFLSTPIGAARDITLHALDLLDGADLLAAEDTRSLRRLMEMHGIALRGRPLLAYHDHNGAAMRPRLIGALRTGLRVAYAPEAGTPMVSDPGYQLAQAAIAEGLPVHVAPGASAVLAALVVSGLPSDRFCFLGFPPAQAGARRRMLAEAAAIPATLVFYEAARRVPAFMAEVETALGGTRRAAICRELTKRFEDVRRGTVAELRAGLEGNALRGEVVVLVDRPGEAETDDPDRLRTALREALRTGTVRSASDAVAQSLNLPRRRVYQEALALREEEERNADVRE